MMLRHFGAAEAADAVEHAIAAILANAKVRTPAIGGRVHQRKNLAKRSQSRSA